MLRHIKIIILFLERERFLTFFLDRESKMGIQRGASHVMSNYAVGGKIPQLVMGLVPAVFHYIVIGNVV